ncbi:LuxR C-terminal-related transcriptional regulator [Winogradskyella maritima]|uniref:Triple tyrosine motif-containing protein n=1 Tax=Winogradskyella maritima TaxID=1517766 RepID=A0ABV8AD99_9FLAO|nr:LuxR C-terminal-related transcriptional regulator [Winogradskyella maritima]
MLLWLSSNAIAQEFPPIQHFSSSDYSAGDQNWSITQGLNNTILIANNRGLLEFNGAQWNLHAVENQAIIRSVAFIDNKVFTGSYMDFGYWERNDFGGLDYTSLANSVGESLIQDEEFWNIIGFKNWILFQSFDRIYVFDQENQNFRIIESDARITRLFRVDDSIFFQRLGQGLFKIENGEEVLISNDALVVENEIFDVFLNDKHLLLLTRNKGFFKLNNGKTEPWFTNLNNLINGVNVYSSLQLQNGNMVLGTISNGVIIIDTSGAIVLRMEQEDGLLNNTVLSLFEDNFNNLWLGLDNGVNVLNLNSPYKVFNDRKGELGTVYVSAIHDGLLYLGTNQGLFYRVEGSNDDFALIAGTEGQVWELDIINNTLLCGHDTGTFQIFGVRANRIMSDNGVWQFQTIDGQPKYLIQGTYKGLSILKNVNGNWEFDRKLEGFYISSRFLEFSSEKELLVSHEYKGVFRLTLSEDLSKIESYESLNVPKSIGSTLFKYNGTIMYANNKGVYTYKNENFSKSDFLKDYYAEDNYVSGKMVVDASQKRLWAFFDNQIIYVDPGNLSNEPQVTAIDLPASLRKSKYGFENILKIQDESYLLGTTEGYIVVDLGITNKRDYDVKIDRVSFSVLNEDKEYLNLEGGIELPNNHNNLHFQYSVSGYESLETSVYQYRLKDIYTDWSAWTTKSNEFFENLPFGDYVFEVRAKVGGQISGNVASYSFSILKPWYLRPLAIVVYVGLFVGFLALVQILNTRYYKKKQKALVVEKERELEYKEIESQRQLVELKNENLRQDIENKNRELGTSTMNLIKKNEILNAIKQELLKAESPKDYTAVVKTIDKNLNATDDWKLFEEAFNNADKDFIKKMKSKHESLTSNDLRLCAYLRLNLSSKEIAPLLNISHKSVEVKRYRLRKKMNLSANQSLTDYVISV